MKYSFMLGLLLLMGLSNLSHAELAKTVKSTRFGTSAEVSRIVELIKLELKPDLQLNVIVRDLGGTTDVSPTQMLYFTLYSKGELFSTDATFNLGAIYDFKSARKISNGLFEIFIGGIDIQTSMPKNKLLIIDARKSISDILKVRCANFDCPASDEFESSIIVTEK